MIVKSRLEIYADRDLKGRAVIAGEKAALKELAKAILQAADGPAGFNNLNLFKGNGHDYEILITKHVNEEEWQAMPNNPESIEFIKNYDELKTNIAKTTST